MSDNVIEMRPGIRVPLPEDFEAVDINHPGVEAALMRECQGYALELHARCYETCSDAVLAQAINFASSTVTLLRSLAAGRMARRASEKAVALHKACQEAIQAAERL